MLHSSQLEDVVPFTCHISVCGFSAARPCKLLELKAFVLLMKRGHAPRAGDSPSAAWPSAPNNMSCACQLLLLCCFMSVGDQPALEEAVAIMPLRRASHVAHHRASNA